MKDKTSTVNGVADAAALLQKFIGGGPLVGSISADDDRAVIVAAQLLAIATQAERIAKALEKSNDLLAIIAYPGNGLVTPTAAGKTRTVPELVELMDGTKVKL